MTMTAIDVAIAAQLEEGPVKGKERTFRCTRHDDQHPSLMVNGPKWICGPCGQSGNAWALAAFLAGVESSDKPAVASWLREHGLSTNGKSSTSSPGLGSIIAAYDHHDASGGLLYQILRYSPKEFRQRRPDGHGGWIWNMHGLPRVPYHLPELLRAVNVYIVEGEKDADNLRKLGLVATTMTGGTAASAGADGLKRVREFASFFQKHQRAVVLGDNDETGKRHQRTVASELTRIVASTKTIDLPGLPEKGDVSDWLRAGGTREQLEALVAAAPDFKPDHDDRLTMRFTKLSDLLTEEEEQTVWLMVDHLPMAGDSLLVAKPKVGKSTLARGLALAVARGSDFLGCNTAQGPVYYLALEEKRSEVRRHFKAMGAQNDDPIFIFCATSPADGLTQLREAMKEEKPVLVIVDPLFRFVRVKDGNDYAAVTNSLEPLHALARETGAHVLAVHHLGKGDRQGGDAVLGSTALFAAVDTLLIMKRSDKYRTLSSIQRYGTDLEEITLEYDPDTRTLSAGLARTEADQAEAEKAILEFFAKTEEAVEENVIHEAVEARRAVKLKAIRKLVTEGKIHRTGTGKKGDRYHYQKVSSTEVPTYIRVPEYLNF